MKTFSLVCLVFFALSFRAQAQSDVSKSRWNSGVISIDGNDKEWAKPLNFYDDKSGLFYAISNDNHNLYLVFSVSDPMKMRKLMRSGWSIELSSKEKKRKFIAQLSFPEVNRMGKGFQRGSNESENRAENNLMVKAYVSQMPDILLKGFHSGQSELKLNSRKDIQIGIDANSDQNLVYEIAIPFDELINENLLKLNELITLNVNVNAMTRPSGGETYKGARSGGGNMRGGGGGGGGGRMGGGGGGHGGGMGGGMREGGKEGGSYNGGEDSGNRSGMSEKASFKQKFVLVRN